MTHQDTALFQAMLDAVSQTLENMVFMEATEQSEETSPEVPSDPAWVSLLIHDPVQGEIRLAMSQELLKQLTGTVFNLDEGEIEQPQMVDILAELLNTIAGLFMTKLLPPDQTYQLGLPEHGEGPLPELEPGSVVWNLQVEGSPLLVTASGVSLVAKNE